MSVRVLQGHVLDVLPTLEPESVNCVVTSPPYWALRRYGTPPQIWDAAEGCEHEWGDELRQSVRGADAGVTAKAGNTKARVCPTIRQQGAFCQRCGAWRGELGSEPDPDLFIAHLVEVFRAVRRVLRSDGVCFVNLADSYIGSNPARVGSGGTHPTPSRQRQRVPAYDSGDREPRDLPGLGSAYPGLCDECLGEWSFHTAHTPAPLSVSEPVGQTVRDSEHQGSERAAVADVPRAAQVSTSLESWLQSRGACSRCESRAALAQSLPPPSSAGVPGFAHTVGYTNGSGRQEWDGRTQDRDVSYAAQGYFTSASHLQPKNLAGIPWRFMLAMQADGWICRSVIAWCKTAAMPESVTDRPTSAWEPVFLFTKSAKYAYDADAVRQAPTQWAGQQLGIVRGVKSRADAMGVQASGNEKPGAQAFSPELGANLRNWWALGPEPLRDEHYAAYPTELVRRCILAGCPKGGTVLDPFGGSGTTGVVADRLERDAVLVELKPEYADLAERRVRRDAPLFAEVDRMDASGTGARLADGPVRAAQTPLTLPLEVA